MSSKLNEIVARILIDTTSLSDQQQAELHKALDAGDLLKTLISGKKISPQQADKLREKAKEVEAAPEIANWTIIRKLGQGGMGAVYKAVHQMKASRVVAMKVLAPQFAQDPEFAERFKREAQAAGKLDHPNVVGFEDYGETKSGQPFFAMEYIDGLTVKDCMEKRGALPLGDALKIARDIAEALDYASHSKIVHRDIKPDNILIVKATGAVKLADLGLAKQMGDENSMTQTGSGFGTPYYMPPEQARNAKYVDQRSDIYALGATLYHMLTNKLPFTGDTAIEVLMAKEKGTFTKPSATGAEVPAPVNLLIDKMMAKDPAHRFQNARELLEQLARIGLHNDRLSIFGGAGGTAKAGGERPKSDPGNVAAAGKNDPKTVRMPAGAASGADNRAAAKAGATRPPSGVEDDTFYLRYKGADGSPVKTKLPRSRVQHLIKGKQLDATVEAAKAPDGPFRKLAAWPEFEALLRADTMAKRVDAKAGTTGQKMTDLLDNFDSAQKSHQRKKAVKGAAFNLVGFVIGGAMLAGGGWAIYKYLIAPMIDEQGKKAEQNRLETEQNKKTMGR